MPAMIDDDAPRSSRKLLLWLFLVVVLGSAAFLLIQFKIIPFGAKRANAPALDTSTAAPAAPPAVAAKPPADTANSDDARAAELRHRLARNGGEYTIYISAFSTAADAEELAGRWERAGFQATVVHAGSWYRVGLGQFETVPAAREEAEKLRMAFEDGYWIGRASVGE